MRIRAEKLLATTQRDVARMPVDDVQKLVHELQIHQVELEMQNDELRSTQQELGEALDRYADLYNFAPVAHLTLNAEGEILEANLKAGELLGLERSRLIHQKFTHFIAPEAQDTFYLLRRRLFTSDTRQGGELELVTAPARRLVVHVEAVREAMSRRKQCRFSFVDITERQRAETALRAANERLNKVLEIGTVGVMFWDVASGVMIDANDTFLRLTGYTRREVAARELTWQQLTPPEFLEVSRAELQKLATTGHVGPYEKEYFRKDGSRQWFVFAGSTLGDGTIVEFCVDVSPQKQAEAALREASQFNQQVIASAQEGIIVFDRDLKHQVWNPFMEALTGLSAAEVIGKHPAAVFPSIRDERIINQLNRALAGETLPPVDLHFEVPPTGRSGWVSNSSAPLRNAKGEIVGAIGIVREITEQKQAEERIAQLNRAKAILAGIDRAIVRTPGRQQLLDEVCRLAVETGGFKLAWIGMVSPEGIVQPVAQAGSIGYLEGICVVTHDVPEGGGPVGTAIRENQPVVIENIQANGRMEPWHDRAREFGLHYVAAFPLRIAGQVAGAFQVYAPRANFFDADELDLLQQVSDDISFALTAMADSAARQQAEEGLRRSEHQLANFFEQAPIGLLWLSAGGTILRANRTQLEMMGYTAEDYLGHAFTEFCTEPNQGRELLKRLAARETVHNFPMTRRCKDGAIRHMLVDAHSLWSGNQFQYSSVFLRDITDRIKLEQEILQVGEREHRRIAQDLHDGLGQLLVGTVYLINTLQKELTAKAIPEARQLRRIMEVINEAIWQTRNLARGLHPVEPEPNGLMSALEGLAARTKKLFHVGCRFACRRPVLIPDNAVATHLFRIAQEAVTNAIKHGQPGRIEISLTETPGRLMLAVKDDGTGMPARQRKQPGMGLRIMRYRAGMIGGSLAVQKKAGGGTTIVCTVHQPAKARLPRLPKTARKKKN